MSMCGSRCAESGHRTRHSRRPTCGRRSNLPGGARNDGRTGRRRALHPSRLLRGSWTRDTVGSAATRVLRRVRDVDLLDDAVPFRNGCHCDEELPPWHEEGEIWRRLKVTFPDDIATHSTIQIFYFDSAGLLKRHDYDAEVLGGTPAAHYVREYQTFSGFWSRPSAGCSDDGRTEHRSPSH